MYYMDGGSTGVKTSNKEGCFTEEELQTFWTWLSKPIEPDNHVLKEIRARWVTYSVDETTAWETLVQR